MPKSMLADVMPEEFIAGGMLAGKRYEDVEGSLGSMDMRRSGLYRRRYLRRSFGCVMIGL